MVYAWNHVKTFRSVLGGIFAWLKGAAGDVVTFVGHHWKLLASILGGPFVALGIFITTHFDGIKTTIVGVLNWIIGQVNTVIGALNSLHVSTPFGNIGVPHIGTIPTAAPAGKPAKVKSLPGWASAPRDRP